MDDKQIIELYFQRRESAIAETQAKYGRLCLRIARNILGSDTDSEECVNDTYMGLWNAIPPARPANFPAFIGRICRNISLNRLSHNNAQKRSAGVTVSFDELEAVLPDALIQSGIEDRELGRLINSFLRSEKEEARNVFIRRYWYFDSVADIAARFTLSESKVKTLLHRSRGRLREYLKKEGVYL